ncbi:hypothetical protein [Pseudodesulfovibrio pelocollis]|uniref:hypothetical protein n=1 Tax=Pseudodesulfovibrio pelocollis TaxID=3051432 RepID=UPI00255ACA29|nr:hypothetical protein [Pseudodesulfovibrio sp. SB368]
MTTATKTAGDGLMADQSLGRRLAALALIAALVWGFMFVAGPRLAASVPALGSLAAFVNETGIETGAYYYTSVEIVGHADHNARSTIEYQPHGPRPE